jgi:hypothetical protein
MGTFLTWVRFTSLALFAQEGKPGSKLEAAVSEALPRTTDGKPDRSGVWQATGTPAGLDVGQAGRHCGRWPGPVPALGGGKIQGVQCGAAER